MNSTFWGSVVWLTSRRMFNHVIHTSKVVALFTAIRGVHISGWFGLFQLSNQINDVRFLNLQTKSNQQSRIFNLDFFRIFRVFEFFSDKIYSIKYVTCALNIY